MLSFKHVATNSNSTSKIIGNVLSVEVFAIEDSGEASALKLDNLSENVTNKFEGLDLNDTISYECVYLLPNNTWSTYGCTLASSSSRSAECS